MAGKWDRFPCASLDFESTSTDPATARIVSAAFVEIPEHGRPKEHTWLVDPGVEVPAEAAAVHGITTEQARAEGTDPGQMLYELAGMVAKTLGRGVPVVVYNAPYDLTLLEQECGRYDDVATLTERLGTGRVGPIVDPMVLARYVDPKRMETVKDAQGNLIYDEGSKAARKRCRGCRCGATDWSLTSTCLHYGVTLPGAHGAAADAIASARLWWKVMGRHQKQFPGTTLNSLHQSQIGWAKQQADKLRGIFNWLGVDDHDDCPDPRNHQCVCPEWPLHRACLRVGVSS